MKILLSTKADKQLRKLPRSMYEIIMVQIRRLGQSQSPQVKKLSGRDCWRLRVGDYRILYFEDKKKSEIIILSVAHRKDAYR